MSAITPAGLHSIATLIKRYVLICRRHARLIVYISSLEASACRLEDIADTLNVQTADYRRRSVAYGETTPSVHYPTGTSNAPAGTVAGANASPQGATAPPAAAAVTSEDAKLVVAYKEDVIEKKLKPFLELTKGFAGPNVVELVCF